MTAMAWSTLRRTGDDQRPPAGHPPSRPACRPPPTPCVVTALVHDRRSLAWPGAVRGSVNDPGNDDIPGPPDLTVQASGASPAPVTGATQVSSDPPAPGHLLSRPSMRPCQNVRMDGLACPCGLGDDYESCCGRLHAGAPAPNAESLMRSSYSAFAVGGRRLPPAHL